MAMIQPPRRVKGFSDREPEWPKLGIWHLGAKYRGTDRTHPDNLKYFRPPEGFPAEELYGTEEPKELPIELPSNDPELCIFDQLEWWGEQEGMKCKGDGEQAECRSEDGWEPRACPCDELAKENCRYVVRLWFLLPKAPGIGVWQVNSSSPVTASRLRGDMRMLQGVFRRLTGIPLILWREKTDFHPMVRRKDGKRGRIKTEHYIPRIKPADTIEVVNPETGELEEKPVTIELLRRLGGGQQGAVTPQLPGSAPPMANQEIPRDLVPNATPVDASIEPDDGNGDGEDPWDKAAEKAEPAKKARKPKAQAKAEETAPPPSDDDAPAAPMF